MHLTLHGYWRSGAAYRVRLALNIKGLAFEQVTYDLRRNEQASTAFRALQPQGLVPALSLDSDIVLFQSLAILEWIEEVYPAHGLLPTGPADRAVVRAMACMVACDIHPLNNLRVLKSLRSDFAADETQIQNWIAHWVSSSFGPLDNLIQKYGEGYCFGDSPTVADCCIVPQVYSAKRFNVDLSSYPHINAVVEKARKTPAFIAAEPECQPDADVVPAPPRNSDSSSTRSIDGRTL